MTIQMPQVVVMAGMILLPAPTVQAQDCIDWIFRTSDGPSARNSPAMAYDSARAVTVMFGGSDGMNQLDDTWEWDGSEWALRATSIPGRRAGAAMAYDSVRGVSVMYGGLPQANRETWEWNGGWTELETNLGPAVRYDHDMVYDSARGVMVSLQPSPPNVLPLSIDQDLPVFFIVLFQEKKI